MNVEEEGIYMSKNDAVRYQIITEFMNQKLTRKEASTLLQVTERTVTRLAGRIEEKGLFGLVHGNREVTPVNKISSAVRDAVMKVVEEKYYDFNMSHCLEMLKSEENIDVKYGTFRRWCHKRELVKHKRRRSPRVRKRRTRMPNEGLLLQMDGSFHRFNGVDEWCLIAAIDDASSDIPYAEFFLSEDTINCMTVLQRIIETKGRPYAIYVDKAGCFGGGKRFDFNQFRNACEQLDIRIIFASSPEAKGRIERTWRTFQDRIIPEMRLRKIRRFPAANNYLQEQFIPSYWRQNNTVIAHSPESRYRPLSKDVHLHEVLCLKDYRTVNRDHTISWDGELYQLDSPVKYSIHKQKIEIRTYQDLTWKAFFAGKSIQLVLLKKDKKTSSDISAA
jgi:transposase